MRFEIDSEEDEFPYLMASTMHDWEVCPLRESVHKDGVNSCPRYIRLLDVFQAMKDGVEPGHVPGR